MKGFLREVFAELSLERGWEVGQMERAQSRGPVPNEDVKTSVGFESIESSRLEEKGCDWIWTFWTLFLGLKLREGFKPRADQKSQKNHPGLWWGVECWGSSRGQGQAGAGARVTAVNGGVGNGGGGGSNDSAGVNSWRRGGWHQGWPPCFWPGSCLPGDGIEPDGEQEEEHEAWWWVPFGHVGL